jgi:hypothetical protein
MPIPKLIVVGLDAATFDVIDPLVEAGDLPNLGGLLGRGARGTLRSTTHPLTPLAWTTMVTGVNAGKHGIWDFSERDGSGYGLQVVNGSHSRAPALWSRLSRAGRKVGIVNVPFTWPAPDVNGFALAGIDAAAREDGMTSPRGLVHELQDRFGRLLLDHSFPVDADGRLDLGLVRRACEQKVAIVDWLVERYEPELLFVVFMAADHVHHLAWPDWEERGRESSVAEAYRILDASLGELLKRAGEDTNVLVVSDHGGGSLQGVVNLNAWLAEQGYLAYTENGSSNGGGAHRLFELRRKLPKEWRYSLKQRLPWLRERAYRLGRSCRAPGSPTSRRRSCTCWTKLCLRPSRAGCWPRRSSPHCSTSGRPSSTTTKRQPRSSPSKRAPGRSRSGYGASATSSRYARRSATIPPSPASFRGAGGVSVTTSGSCAGSSTSTTNPASARRRANGSWWSSTASPCACSRGTTTGRLPSATTVITEPTPAWETTTRARRTCSSSSG